MTRLLAKMKLSHRLTLISLTSCISLIAAVFVATGSCPWYLALIIAAVLRIMVDSVASLVRVYTLHQLVTAMTTPETAHVVIEGETDDPH